MTFTVGLVYTDAACTVRAAGNFWMTPGGGQSVTLRKPLDTCTLNVIGNTVKFVCVDGVIMEHVYHDILDGSNCSSVPGACTCSNAAPTVTTANTYEASASGVAGTGYGRSYIMPITNGCTMQVGGPLVRGGRQGAVAMRVRRRTALRYAGARGGVVHWWWRCLRRGIL